MNLKFRSKFLISIYTLIIITIYNQHVFNVMWKKLSKCVRVNCGARTQKLKITESRS